MKPRLLDLFCGGGGAAQGYHDAGWEVVGVDLEPQPRFPFEFHRADAMTFPLDGFDAVHASPPCQSYSRNMRHLSGPAPMLIDAVRERLEGAGVALWVIENVEGSGLPDQSDLFGAHGVMLCGTGFGLRVARHRWFESSIALHGPPCRSHDRIINPHRQESRDRMYAEFGRQDPERLWRAEMGVAWLDRDRGRQAIPPAYTRHIGDQLLTAWHESHRAVEAAEA